MTSRVCLPSFALAVLSGWLLGDPEALAASPLPKPLLGWRIEVVAEAPQLKHPSVVAVAPDGRVFVAEDPMDISTPKADATEGRILCLFPDGRMTVFAEKLHAVFGLQYLEGKVYVLHNPKFSVFEDDNGIGRNRRELIEQTLPEPWALNWNDHVPANFRLAMDGFFYVASGDKGLHGAQGTDGSRATLSSGGIFRIRPDGTRLEVVSHGVRNILDVALNSEDEQFTYDNTDEHDWMGRLTHMVEAGFYGYPHDFIPRRAYTLWMMEDYGAGAACGVLAYTEDALPTEYRDNLFLADFGKRQIMRVRVERDGGTYRAVSKEDLFPNPPGDFRPVGITLGADGRSLYICDWQHRDEKASVSVGRLLKLSWTGPDLSDPKPWWHLPAAMGKPTRATVADLVAGLSHPARSVRLAAQRVLSGAADHRGIEEAAVSVPAEERGRFASAAAKALESLLSDRSAPFLARCHALWALDAMVGGRSTNESILAAAADDHATVRRQALRQFGMRRATNAIPVLVARLRDKEASVRFQAASALGRIADPKAVSALVGALEEPDLFARHAVFTALNRIGTHSPAAWPVIAQALESLSARVREGTVFALRETYSPELVAALASVFHDGTKLVDARRAALGLIAALHHQRPEWKGQWWAYHPALRPPPPKTVSWPGTDAVLAVLRDGLREEDPALRRAAIDALAIARDTHSAAALRALYPRETDPSSRATILRALGAMKDSEALGLVTSELNSRSHPDILDAAMAAAEDFGGEQAIQALSKFLGEPSADGGGLAQAIRALGNLGANQSLPAIEPLSKHAHPAVRAAVLIAMGRMQGTAALSKIEAGLDDASPEVHRVTVKTLGNLKSTNAVPALLRAYSNPALRVEAFQALARTPDARALGALLDGLSSRNPTERNAAHLAIRDLSGRVLKSVESRAESLSPQALTELRQIYAGNPEAESGPLFARKIEPISLAAYLDAASRLPGDATRGRLLFAEPGGLNCVACHRVSGVGSDLGPDLTGAGAQFDRRSLAEAILYPSKTVREGYQQITIERSDDEELSGVIKGETSDTLTLRDSSGHEHSIPRASIKARRNSALSLMPEGLQAALTLEEFADLIAYLSSLKGQAPPSGVAQ